MRVTKEGFGRTRDGQEISLYTVSNSAGAVMKVTDFGAILVSLLVPDKEGNQTDVVLGFDSGEAYQQDNDPHFGATIGRNGNRIFQSRFQMNGKEIRLTPNENGNNLHSGPIGYDSILWEASEVPGGIAFHRISPDGEQGFPGTFDITVTYLLTDDNQVEIHYHGRSDQDTVANMTNHSYFNLAGHASGNIADQMLQLNASKYTPVRDSGSIPTGEILPVAGTPLDFREPKKIGEEIDADFQQLKFTGGYDHNFVLDKEHDGLDWMARAYCGKSGIFMEAFTDCPGVQFYTGNFISGQIGKGGTVYEKRQGFCLESQFFPNAVNEPAFRQPFLKAGEWYDSTTIYRFSVKK